MKKWRRSKGTRMRWRRNSVKPVLGPNDGPMCDIHMDTPRSQCGDEPQPSSLVYRNEGPREPVRRRIHISPLLNQRVRPPRGRRRVGRWSGWER